MGSLSLWLLMSVFVVASCASKPKSSNDVTTLFNQAEKVRKESHAAKAELMKSQELYLQVLKNNPQHAPSWLGLAKVMKRLGYINGHWGYEEVYVRQALPYLNKALEYQPKFAEAAAEMSHSFVALSDFESAREWIEKAKSFDSTDSTVWQQSAILHLATKDFEEVLKDVAQGMNFTKTDHEKAVFLEVGADAHVALNQHDRSIKNRLEAQKLLPGSPWALGNVAAAYLQAGDWKNCLEWSERALEKLNYAMARVYYRTCAIESRKFDLALGMKWKAPKENAPVPVSLENQEQAAKYAYIGWILENRDKNFTEALKNYDEAIKLDPANTDYPKFRRRASLWSAH